jgi:excisionase family DNA binding protein
MDVRAGPVQTSNREGTERERSGAEVVLSRKNEHDQVVAPEFLLELLTLEEIASALRVSPSWVYERVRKRGKDKMPHLKVGKYLRFRLKEVRRWVDGGEAQ